MVQNMFYEEIGKVHEKLGLLMQEGYEFNRKWAREFASSKNIALRDILSGKVTPEIALEFGRYLSEASGIRKSQEIPEDVIIESLTIDDIPAEWISVPGASKEKVYLNLFGGGYVLGNLKSRRWTSYLMSRATNLRSLNIEYRLAPEHPFPAALEDAVKSYKWLLSKNYDPSNIIIGGQSAGGGLTIATLLKLRELQIPYPKGAIVMSPWADLTGEAKSLEYNKKYDPEMAEGTANMAKLYVPNKSYRNPFVSPVFADLTGLPPILIQVGSIEGLLDDSVKLAENAKSAGVKVTLEVYDKMTHVFQSFGDDLPESMEAFEKAAKFLASLY
ncbi:MAG: alpha/beta hydrolase [Candidatus Lokiarchaeota archaeon]|nr:alpha/beta hydrolase [Candidatus Lokiarchaeota archaeon]